MSGFSQAYATKTLEHVSGKKELAKPTMWLALLTVVPTNASTGATITEATYTGYLRKEVPASVLNSAVAGTPSSINNKEAFTFAACTGGSSTIIAWAACDSSETAKGNVIMWGTAASTVISTTQTPASIAAEVLSLTLV
jgi:hypothetical protein